MWLCISHLSMYQGVCEHDSAIYSGLLNLFRYPFRSPDKGLSAFPYLPYPRDGI